MRASAKPMRHDEDNSVFERLATSQKENAPKKKKKKKKKPALLGMFKTASHLVGVSKALANSPSKRKKVEHAKAVKMQANPSRGGWLGAQPR